MVRRLAPALLFLLVGCRGDLGDACSEDGECRRGLTCWGGNSFQVNTNSELGQCSSPCDSESDCPEEGTCVIGLCARRCEGEGDPVCSEGTTCYGEWCVRTCTADADCGSDSHCPAPGGICAPGRHCDVDDDCNPSEHCPAPGGVCAPNVSE